MNVNEMHETGVKRMALKGSTVKPKDIFACRKPLYPRTIPKWDAFPPVIKYHLEVNPLNPREQATLSYDPECDNWLTE